MFLGFRVKNRETRRKLVLCLIYVFTKNTESYRAIPHNYCRAIAQSGFSSDCTEISLAY